MTARATATDNCDEIEDEDWPPWFKARFTPERVKVMCERIVADNGKDLVEQRA